MLSAMLIIEIHCFIIPRSPQQLLKKSQETTHWQRSVGKKRLYSSRLDEITQLHSNSSESLQKVVSSGPNPLRSIFLKIFVIEFKYLPGRAFNLKRFCSIQPFVANVPMM